MLRMLPEFIPVTPEVALPLHLSLIYRRHSFDLFAESYINYKES